MPRQGKINDGMSGEFAKGGASYDGKPILDHPTQEKLGRVFRDYCKSLIEQPIPVELISLLTKIEAKERSET